MTPNEGARQTAPREVLPELLLHKGKTTLREASPELIEALCKRLTTCSSFSHCKENGFPEFYCCHRNILQGKLEREEEKRKQPSQRQINTHKAEYTKSVLWLYKKTDITCFECNNILERLERYRYDFKSSPYAKVQHMYNQLKNPTECDPSLQ